jgi:NitT/TauT family transport system substrate-binding protein
MRRYVTVLVLSVLLITSIACRNEMDRAPSARASTRPHVSIGIQVSPAMALLMVAKDKGYFTAEGVDVDLKPFTAGKFALQAFLARSIDYAVPGDVPAALAILQGHDIRVVSQVVDHTTNEVRVVALRDAAHSDAASYFKSRKRKLATSFGGGPEFYTHQFLSHYGIGQDAVEIISQKPEDMPAALASKSVDAVSVFDPFAYMAEKRVGADAVTFTDPSLYSELYILVARPDQLTKERSTIVAILRALRRAQSYVSSNPDDAKAIMMRYTTLDRDVVDAIWPNFTFAPALTDELLTFWRAEEPWARATGKVAANTATPDFSKYIDGSLLKEALSKP